MIPLSYRFQNDDEAGTHTHTKTMTMDYNNAF